MQIMGFNHIMQVELHRGGFRNTQPIFVGFPYNGCFMIMTENEGVI
jgi:hypothetical protein